MLNLVRSLAAAHGIQCKCQEVFINNGLAVEVVIPLKALMPDSYIDMLLPDGATGKNTGLGVMLITKFFTA